MTPTDEQKNEIEQTDGLQAGAVAEANAETPAAEGDAAPPAPVNPNLKWYIIHTYSGF